MGDIEQRGQPPGSSKSKLDDMGGNGGQHWVRKRLAPTTALVAIVLGGYGGREARAGACYASGGGIYSCTGAANAAADVTQNLSGAPLTVTTTPGFGIDTSISGGDALNLTSNSGSLSFTDNSASAITGAVSGIDARNYGFGALSVSASGQVTGNTNYGIHALNVGTDLTISAAAVSPTGGTDGIKVINFGTGHTSVSATGPVTGSTGDGISVANSGTDLTISAAAVGGAQDGIYARNFGRGELTVTTTGLVRGTNSEGIYALNSGHGTDLTISATSVTAGADGIEARNDGSGALSVTASGRVAGLGTFSSGIFAINSDNGTDLTISSVGVVGTLGASVSGQRGGIEAINNGSGALSVTTNGSVLGGSKQGILADNSANGTDLTISVAHVVRGSTGIVALNHGAGTTSVTVSGIVTGNTSAGVDTQTGAGGMSVITLNAGADVSAAGIAIVNDAGNSITTVNAGAGVTGNISLGDGSDDLIFDGGNFSGVTSFDGGDDTSTADGFIDTLTFRNVTGTVAGAAVTNWENVVIGSGAVVSFSDSGLTTGRLGVTNGGTLSMLDGTDSAFLLDGNLDFSSGGSLALDVFSVGLFDSLQITGAADFDPLSQIDFLLNINPVDLFDGFSVSFLTADSISGFNNLNFSFSGLDPLFTASVALNSSNSALSLNLNRIGNPPTSVPEPASVALFGAGLLGLLLRRVCCRRRRHDVGIRHNC